MNDLFLKNQEFASCGPAILVYLKAPGYFRVFLLYSCLPKTLITFQPGHAPTLRIDFPRHAPAIFKAAAQIEGSGRCPFVRQIQQSGQQRVGPESSADHLRTPGHF